MKDLIGRYCSISGIDIVWRRKDWLRQVHLVVQQGIKNITNFVSPEFIQNVLTILKKKCIDN